MARRSELLFNFPNLFSPFEISGYRQTRPFALYVFEFRCMEGRTTWKEFRCMEGISLHGGIAKVKMGAFLNVEWQFIAVIHFLTRDKSDRMNNEKLIEIKFVSPAQNGWQVLQL